MQQEFWQNRHLPAALRANYRESGNMKRINVRFEKDNGRRDIDVVFTASEVDNQVAVLMNKVADPISAMWEVRDEEGAAVTLSEDDIHVVSVDNKKLKITADDGTYWLKMPLQDMEAALNPSMFLRVSRYDIVNLQKVQRFDFSVSGTLCIQMEGGQETWASRRFIPAVRERLKRRA